MKLPKYLQEQTVLANHQVVAIVKCKLVKKFIKVKIILKGHETTEFPQGDTWLSLKQLDDNVKDRVFEFIASSGFCDSGG